MSQAGDWVTIYTAICYGWVHTDQKNLRMFRALENTLNTELSLSFFINRNMKVVFHLMPPPVRLIMDSPFDGKVGWCSISVPVLFWPRLCYVILNFCSKALSEMWSIFKLPSLSHGYVELTLTEVTFSSNELVRDQVKLFTALTSLMWNALPN